MGLDKRSAIEPWPGNGPTNDGHVYHEHAATNGYVRSVQTLHDGNVIKGIRWSYNYGDVYEVGVWGNVAPNSWISFEQDDMLTSCILRAHPYGYWSVRQFHLTTSRGQELHSGPGGHETEKSLTDDVKNKVLVGFKVYENKDRYIWGLGVIVEDKARYKGATIADVTYSPNGLARASQTFSMKSDKGKYVCAEMGTGHVGELIANRDGIGPWEKFDRIDLPSGKVALRAHSNGQIVEVEDGTNRLIAKGDIITAKGEFEWKQAGSGGFGLLAYNGKYVQAVDGGGKEVAAIAPHLAGWEIFKAEGDTIIQPTITEVSRRSPAKTESLSITLPESGRWNFQPTGGSLVSGGDFKVSAKVPELINSAFKQGADKQAQNAFSDFNENAALTLPVEVYADPGKTATLVVKDRKRQARIPFTAIANLTRISGVKDTEQISGEFIGDTDHDLIIEYQES